MSGIVSDFMTRDPITVSPETPLKEAIKILADNHISGLPVLDAQNQLVGVISESELMWQESGMTPPAYIMLLDSVIYLKNPATYDRDLHKVLGQTVGEVMTRKPLTVQPDRPLTEAARLLHERKVHRLFVVDGQGTLLGVLTRGDVVRALAAQQTDG
jgi:CBS domain-containing protein